MSADRTVKSRKEPLVITEKKSPATVIKMAIDSGCSHICQKDGHAFAQELESSNLLLSSSETLLKFPIASILSPGDLSNESERARLAIERCYDNSNQKLETLTSFTNALEAKGLPQTIIDDAISVTDELFTNAVYNAPFVDLLTHRNPGLSRVGTAVQLPNGKFNRIFLAHDEQRLVVGCHDPFGSLELVSFLTKIKATYETGAATINFGAGGAGLGSFIIFNAGASLYFGVWPGRATVLCCVIPLGISNRKRGELAKHFHWIQR